jgi:hypothetical protein
VKRLDALAQAILVELTVDLAVGERRALGAERHQNAIVVDRLDTPAYAVAHVVAGWGEEADASGDDLRPAGAGRPLLPGLPP